MRTTYSYTVLPCSKECGQWGQACQCHIAPFKRLLALPGFLATCPASQKFLSLPMSRLCRQSRTVPRPSVALTFTLRSCCLVREPDWVRECSRFGLIEGGSNSGEPRKSIIMSPVVLHAFTKLTIFPDFK